MAVLPGVSRLWALARTVEDLFKLQEQFKDSIKEIGSRLRSIEDRMIKLEAEQPQVIDRARTAASTASTVVTAAALSDLITRLTRAERRIEDLEHGSIHPEQSSTPKRLASPRTPGRKRKDEAT